MTSSPEITHYQDGAVRITNARAILGSKTFAIANITSVTKATIPANRTPGLLLAFIGAPTAGCLGSFVIGMGGSLVGAGGNLMFFVAVIAAVLIGLGVFVGGIVLAAQAKPTYSVMIGSSAGEKNALMSKNPKYISEIVDAMNTAIIGRG